MFSKVQSLADILVNTPQGVTITPENLRSLEGDVDSPEYKAGYAAAELAARQKDAKNALTTAKHYLVAGTTSVGIIILAILLAPGYPYTLLGLGFPAGFYAKAYNFYEKYQQLLI